MAGLNGLIQAMNNMQTDAQAALPVDPNNGNPMGANNMPAQQNKALQHYPWLGPSPYMTSVRERLAAMGNKRGVQLAQPQLPTQQVAPVQQQMLPILPQRMV